MIQTGAAPPRVLIVMADQRLRPLLRAALRQIGYDALGARDIEEALSYPVADRGRGPVRLIIHDQALQDIPESLWTRLIDRYSQPATLLLASALAPHSSCSGAVIQRPTSIAEIARAVQARLPLPEGAVHPID